jgi:hypothetical protein
MCASDNESEWKTARRKRILAKILTERGTYQEAETLLLDSYKTLAAEPKIKDETVNTIRELIELYTSSERSNELQMWQKKLDDLHKND